MIGNFAFRKLETYQLAKELVLESYQMTSSFPSEEKFSLVQQMNRAAVSIPSNIAEGYGRESAKDKSHFFNIAYGSLMELVCQLEISCSLKYISEEQLDSISSLAYRLAIKINNLRKHYEEKPGI